MSYNKVLKNDIGWENSDLRKWLNEDFYQTAFSEEERASILETDNETKIVDETENTIDKIYISKEPVWTLDSSYWVREIVDYYYGHNGRQVFAYEDGEIVRKSIWLTSGVLPEMRVKRSGIKLSNFPKEEIEEKLNQLEEAYKYCEYTN